MKSGRLIAFTVSAIALASSSPAHAYLDPGTGTMLLQAILGVIAVGLVTLKFYWQRVTSTLTAMFGRRGKEQPVEQPDELRSGNKQEALSPKTSARPPSEP
jgi:hypothetical protein